MPMKKKKKSLLRPFSSLFPLPTSNRIISFFNIIVSSIYPIQGWWYSFNKKGWNTSLFIYLWYRLLALKTRKIILIVLITARKAHCCRNVDSRLFDSFLFFFLILLHPFHEALSVSNWRLRHSFITTSCPRFLRSPFPSRPCERGCIYKSSNYTLISHSVGMTKFHKHYPSKNPSNYYQHKIPPRTKLLIF